MAEDDGEATVGKLVGYSVVTWGWSLESGGLDCILDEIYVERRRVGSESRLLAYSIDEARHAEHVMAAEPRRPTTAPAASIVAMASSTRTRPGC
ncbi:MAG: hypothetical protein R2710_12900 [Acidimicrobiales bacterium]